MRERSRDPRRLPIVRSLTVAALFSPTHQMTRDGALRRGALIAAGVLFAYGGLARARPPEGRASSEGSGLSERRIPLVKGLVREERRATIAARHRATVADRRLRPLENSTARAASGPACESTGFEATEATCQWEEGWICGSTFTSCVSDHDLPQVCTGDPIVDENCCADNPNPLNGWYVSIASQHCNEPHVEPGAGVGGGNSLRFQRDPEGGELDPDAFGGPSGCFSLGGACRVSAFTPSVSPQPIGPTTISFDLSISDVNAEGADGWMNYFTIADSETDRIGPNFLWWGYNGHIWVYDNSRGAYAWIGYYLYSGRYQHYEITVDPCSGVVTYTQNGTLVYSHDFTRFANTVERALFTHDNRGIATWDLDNYTVTRGEPCGGACCDLVAGSCFEVESVNDCSGSNMVYSEGKDCTIVECMAITAACCDSSPGAGGDCRDVTLANCSVSDQVTWSKGVACDDGLCAETPGACCDTGPGSGGACEEVLLEDCPVGSQVSWTKGISCMEVGCTETAGACCNTLEGTCTGEVLSANCEGPQRQWNKGASCSAVPCNAVLGACCDSGSQNPTIVSCSQTTQAECDCAKCTWHKLENCEEIVCDPNFAPIPTVSQWGIAIMTLLLLVAGKVHFGRRAELREGAR